MLRERRNRESEWGEWVRRKRLRFFLSHLPHSRSGGLKWESISLFLSLPLPLLTLRTKIFQICTIHLNLLNFSFHFFLISKWINLLIFASQKKKIALIFPSDNRTSSIMSRGNILCTRLWSNINKLRRNVRKFNNIIYRLFNRQK